MAAVNRTDITFTGVSVGTTYVTVGDTTYKIVVTPKTENVSVLKDATTTVTGVNGALDMTGLDTTIATVSVENGTMTVTGVKAGETRVTVGSTIYKITVTEEDLSEVTSITVEYWITNRQVTADSATSKTIRASDITTDGAKVYSEAGAEFSALVPKEGSRGSDTTAFWKGTRLTSDKKQTGTSGVDRTLSGDDFKYIRYWNQKWSFSADGETWTDIDSSDQIVAYYLQKTEVTEHVTTEVKDWGVERSKYNSNNFVLLDYAVKLQGSTTTTPNSFPVSGKTLAFHCDSNDSTTVHYDSTARKYYRTIGTIKAEETADYEVYMITLTPTSDTSSETVATNAMNATDYTYAGTEKVVWVDDEANLPDNFTDSSTHTSDYHVGGEAIVDSINIYNQQGMLVTYYVRAKETADSLSVHYIDKVANEEFYTYNIAVNKGTAFDKNIGLADDWKGNLVNGSVQNKLGAIETVSADLSTMPAIGARYQWSKYTCTEVKRSDDGKEVYLYYTFNNTHSFVADFGLAMNITTNDLEIEGTWTSATVSNPKYGTASAATDEGVTTITYTPTQTFEGVDTLVLNLKGTNDNKEEVSSSQTIYIYPATTVYYEEGFANYSGTWTGGTNKGTGTQTTSAVIENDDNDLYGYDDTYSNSKKYVGPSNDTEAATTATGNAMASFTFTGTGVDIYANCTTATGTAMVIVRKGSATGDLVKLFSVDTKMANGTTDLTTNQAVSGYNIPIVSLPNLSSSPETYYVTVALVKSGKEPRTDGLKLDGFRVYNTLGSNMTAQTVYGYDNEDNPSFTEVRNLNLSAVNITDYANGQYGTDSNNIVSQVYTAVATGDGSEVKAAILNGNKSYTDQNDLKDLVDNGPKNEVYLRNNQTLVLTVNTDREVQIGLKALDKATSYTINGNKVTLNASTDMFYTALAKQDKVAKKTITITNNGEGILSVTQLKICDEAASNAIQPVSEESIKTALTELGVIEPEVQTADAAANIKLVDYAGNEIAATALTANGEAGKEAAFTADAIREAADSVLPEGYGYADATAITDQTVAYGESSDVTVQVGKLATLKVTYKKLFGKTVGTATLTAVQTSSASQYTFSAAQIRNAVPDGYWTIKLAGKKVKFGSSGTLTVQVF